MARPPNKTIEDILNAGKSVEQEEVKPVEAITANIPDDKATALKKRAELLKQLEEIEAIHGTTPDDPEELRPFLVDLAPHSQGYIDYNGTRYYQGQIYQVNYYLYCALNEIQGNTHKHERTLREPDNQYRRRQNRSVG